MSFTDAQKREIQAIIGQRGTNRRGLVTSYQPQPPMVKVQIVPFPTPPAKPTETGWIPYKTFATGLAGNGWSVVAPPQADQQVLLICEEGDGQNYTAWGGYYSDADPAPTGAQAGEIMFSHQSGSMLHLQADGTILLVSATVVVSGDMAVSGTVSAADVIVAGNVSSKNHEHFSSSPGAPTSAPIGGT